MNCLDCKRLDLQTHKKHTLAGVGQCLAMEKWHFVSFTVARDCANYQPAPPDVVKARKEWSRK